MTGFRLRKPEKMNSSTVGGSGALAPVAVSIRTGATAPPGSAGVLVVGNVVDVREALTASARPEVMYGGS